MYDVTLNDALSAQGMDIAFASRRADFSRMTNSAMFVSMVKHTTFVEVNEVGTRQQR